MGCLKLLKADYYKQLERLDPHIKCFSFNPIASILSPIVNNRDHRKILVVDGYIAFTGGINLADEYINEKVKFGHWKDTGVKLEGEGTWNFTVMFLDIWRVFKKDDTDVNLYKPERYYKKAIKPIHDKGYVLAYCDNPLDYENIGEDVYMEILNQAKKYVYIFTPYLIVDHEMRYALCLAAKRGVDVRIVTPGIPDKKIVYRITRANYLPLLKAGVKIYEYTPGFMHAKSFVSDDNLGVVGSINMDYRSLFLHFECATLMYQCDAIKELKKDCLESIDVSKEVEMQDCNTGALGKVFDAVLRVLAPLF
jgi:cardiolipin synthase